MKILSQPLSLEEGLSRGSLAVFLLSDEPVPSRLPGQNSASMAEMLMKDPSFKGKKGKIARIPLEGEGFSFLYLVGLGEKKGYSEDNVRSRTAELLRRCRADGVERITLLLPETPGEGMSAALAEGAEKNLFLLGIGAFLATAIIQSAPTVLALTVTLAVSGVLSEAAIVPIVLGAHAGSSVTVLIAGLSGRQNARKLGISTFVYKVIGVLAIIPFVPWLQEFIAGTGGRAASKIVLVQVGITLVNALMFYFFVDQLAWISSLLSEKMGKERLSAPVYLDDEVLEIPSLSILLLSKEMIRLANFIEMYCQILFRTDQAVRDFPELPGAIRDLSEICEEYMYGIHIPADDDSLRESYSTVSYSMVSFRQMAKILSGELRLLAEAGVADQLAKEVGQEMWDELSRTALTDIRISLRAFALADADFAGFAGRYEREYEQLDRKIRLRLGADALNRRELAPLLDFLTQIFLLVKTSLDVARREGYSESSIV